MRLLHSVVIGRVPEDSYEAQSVLSSAKYHAEFRANAVVRAEFKHDLHRVSDARGADEDTTSRTLTEPACFY